MATVMLTYKGQGPAHGCVVCLMCNVEGILVIRKQNTVNAESLCSDAIVIRWVLRMIPLASVGGFCIDSVLFSYDQYTFKITH